MHVHRNRRTHTAALAPRAAKHQSPINLLTKHLITPRRKTNVVRNMAGKTMIHDKSTGKTFLFLHAHGISTAHQQLASARSMAAPSAAACARTPAGRGSVRSRGSTPQNGSRRGAKSLVRARAWCRTVQPQERQYFTVLQPRQRQPR